MLQLEILVLKLLPIDGVPAPACALSMVSTEHCCVAPCPSIACIKSEFIDLVDEACKNQSSMWWYDSRAIASCDVAPLEHEALYYLHVTRCICNHSLPVYQLHCLSMLFMHADLGAICPHTRWKQLSLKCRGFPELFPIPASPVHNCRKLSAVCTKKCILMF